MPLLIPLFVLACFTFSPGSSHPTAAPKPLDPLYFKLLPENRVDPDYNVPEVPEAPEIPYEERNSPTHAYAVDVAFRTTYSDMNCLKSKGYKTVFVRAFNPAGDGYFDREALDTINNAYHAGLGSEIYITPQINSSRSGADQVSIVFESLRNSGITVRSMWIQVTSPSNWPASMDERVNFIQDMLQRIRDMGINAGIYTAFYDWLEITGGWNTGNPHVLLWYWHVLGMGVDGETNATLDDFRPFGPWKSAFVKQFAQVEKVCGMIVNRNVYATRAQAPSEKRLLTDEEEMKVKVGAIGF